MSLKIVLAVTALMGSASAIEYESYPSYLQATAAQAAEEQQTPASAGFADSFGIKQGIEDLDPLTAIGISVG